MMDLSNTPVLGATQPIGQPDTPSDIGSRPERTGDVLCPHCDCVGHKRTSRAITKQHRQIYYQCSNVMCGHTWLRLTAWSCLPFTAKACRAPCSRPQP